jgi:acetyl-CoA carboxylase carboxyl transferase subunit beta
VGNRVLILENAFYSVISPEGCSTILFGSAAESARAAEQLRISAPELLRLGVVDGVVPEPAEGAHTDRVAAADHVGSAVRAALAELSHMTAEELLAQRYERFSRFGNPTEATR